MYKHIYIQIYIYIQTYMYLYTYVYIYMYIYMHAHTYTHSLSFSLPSCLLSPSFSFPLSFPITQVYQSRQTACAFWPRADFGGKRRQPSCLHLQFSKRAQWGPYSACRSIALGKTHMIAHRCVHVRFVMSVCVRLCMCVSTWLAKTRTLSLHLRARTLLHTRPVHLSSGGSE